jgi:hypothetical protein
MTLNLPLLYFVWTEEYCQTSPNKNKSPNLWHATSILVCCIFEHVYANKGHFCIILALSMATKRIKAQIAQNVTFPVLYSYVIWACLYSFYDPLNSYHGLAKPSSDKKWSFPTSVHCIVSYAMLSLNKVGAVFSCLSVSFVGLLLFRTRLQNRLNKLSLYSVCMYAKSLYRNHAGRCP